MIRVPVYPPGLLKKLDVQWMKGIWVGRLDESDGHVVLTPHGTVTGRSVRRLAGNLRVQPDLVGKIKSRVQDPSMSFFFDTKKAGSDPPGTAVSARPDTTEGKRTTYKLEPDPT